MRRTRTVAWGLAAAAATAGLWWFGNGLMPRWPLMWLAPLPVLLFALEAPWPVAAVTAFAAWMAGALNLWGYFKLLGTPFVVWVEIFGMASLAAAAAVLLFRALVLRGARWSGMAMFAALWVAMEFLRGETTPHGTAGSLAYTQLRFLPFLQLASLTGPWGMTFVLLLFPAGLACALHLWLRKQDGRAAWSTAAVTCGVVGAVLVFGWVRLAVPQPGPRVTVGLAASDLPANEGVAEPGADAMRLLAAYASQAQRLAGAGAQAVVLPEKLAVVRNGDVTATDALFQPVADKTGAVIVVGVLRNTGLARYNQARVYQPGAAVASYDKEHMLPPFESPLTPGRRLLPLQAAAAEGVAICKDMDFAAPASRYGQDATGLLLVPAWDFRVDRVWHGHIAVMRGVEDGFSLARAAKDGFLTVSDNRGRIVAERRSDAAPFATLLATVPAGHTATLYLHWGDWFAWVCCSLALLLAVRLLVLQSGGRHEGR